MGGTRGCRGGDLSPPCPLPRISLNTLTLNVRSEKVYTRHGVPISVTGIAQVPPCPPPCPPPVSPQLSPPPAPQVPRGHRCSPF